MYRFGDKVKVVKGFYEGLRGTLVEIVRENPTEYILLPHEENYEYVNIKRITVTNSDLERW